MDRRGRNPLPKQKKSIFDGLPIATDKSYLREDLAKIDEGWTVARFDSLPHVVHILTSKDRETEAQHLKEQSEIIEEIVDEVVHAYHSGFNKAIQNYSQILRLFSESAESIGKLKVDLAEAKKLLGSRNKQLHQLWYRSVTLRHIISLLDQIENVSKVPARVEKLISAKHLYAAVQLHVQSMMMLEREGLHGVGALQDARSELSKLRGVLFYKIVEDLHSHLYNKGEFCGIQEKDDDIQRMTAATSTISGSRPSSRRTHTRSDNQLDSPSFRKSYMRPGSMDGSSFDGHDDDTVRSIEAPEDGYDSSILVTRINGLDGSYKDSKTVSHRIPSWLLSSTPNEFIESMTKSDERMHVKYLQTLVECLCMLGKVAAGGAVLCQRFRPTIHEIIVSKINVKASEVTSLRLTDDRASPHPGFIANYIKGGPLQSPGLLNPKNQKETSLTGAAFAISPVSAAMAPNGTAQVATRVLLTTIFDSITRVLENHIAVGALLETRSTQSYDMNTPKSVNGDATWGSESEGSQATGGYSVGFSLAVIQSECQQLICEILRATPEAASADAAVQTARLANKAPAKEKRNKVDEGLSFAFRFTDGALPLPSEGIDAIRQAWGRRNPNTKEGYGTSKVLPDQGIYLIASIYRPVVQFTDKVASMLPEKYSQLGNDGLQAFVENFLKDHFLPALFVDYRKCVQQAISSPAAFRPRTHVVSSYTPLVEKGRPVLQGLLAIDFLAKEVLGWAQAMPKYAGELVEYVQTFLERTYERSRTSFMEAVLEKQSYKLMGRQDVESLMKHEPASACLFGQPIMDQNGSDSETIELEREISDLLLGLQPIKQENLIRDDNKLILLASLSDSLEYLADSILRLGQNSSIQSDQTDTQLTEQIPYSASPLTEGLRSLSNEYRSLAVECLKVLRLEMQLETIFHLQEMTSREYLEDQDAEEPEDFIISLTSQVTRRDEEISAFVPEAKRNYIFNGIYGVAANASIKALADLKSINLFGVQQICRNSIALEQALTAIPPIDSEAVQQRLDRVRTYYELLNLPFEALLAFISEHEHLFSKPEYLNLLNVRVLGREIPEDAPQRVSDILSH